MSLSCHSESLIYKASSFWVVRDIIRKVDLLAAFVLIFLYHVSSSVRSIIIQEIMMMYKAFSYSILTEALFSYPTIQGTDRT